MPFSAPRCCPPGFVPGDAHGGLTGGDRLDDGGDRAVVEQDRVTGTQRGDGFGQGAAETRGVPAVGHAATGPGRW